MKSQFSRTQIQKLIFSLPLDTQLQILSKYDKNKGKIDFSQINNLNQNQGSGIKIEMGFGNKNK